MAIIWFYYKNQVGLKIQDSDLYIQNQPFIILYLELYIILWYNLRKI